MLCTNTLMMVGGGLLAGYGASQAMETKKYTKLEVLGPLVGGLAILGFGLMNYKKGGCGKAKVEMVPPSPSAKESAPMSNTPATITQTRPVAKITGYPTFVNTHSSGNQSAQYDYNHIYPGFI